MSAGFAAEAVAQITADFEAGHTILHQRWGKTEGPICAHCGRTGLDLIAVLSVPPGFDAEDDPAQYVVGLFGSSCITRFEIPKGAKTSPEHVAQAEPTPAPKAEATRGPRKPRKEEPMSKIEKVEIDGGVTVFVYKPRRGYMGRQINGKWTLQRAKQEKKGWRGASHLATFNTKAEAEKAAQEKAAQHLAMVGRRASSDGERRPKVEKKAKAPKAEKAPKAKATKKAGPVKVYTEEEKKAHAAKVGLTVAPPAPKAEEVKAAG